MWSKINRMYKYLQKKTIKNIRIKNWANNKEYVFKDSPKKWKHCIEKAYYNEKYPINFRRYKLWNQITTPNFSYSFKLYIFSNFTTSETKVTNVIIYRLLFIKSIISMGSLSLFPVYTVYYPLQSPLSSHSLTDTDSQS